MSAASWLASTMPTRRAAFLLSAAGPALILAIATVFHPAHLTDVTAARWLALHFGLIVIFPLVGFAPWLIARTAGRSFGVAAAILGLFYAAFYTSLDVLAGVGAGSLQLSGHADAKGPLYAQGHVVATIGVVALALAVLVASIAAISRFGLRALPGAVLALAGSVLLYSSHIYFGWGTVSMLLLASGFGWLAWTVSAPSPGDASGSAARPAQ